MIHKLKCQNNDITTIRTSPKSHIHWKNHFHKNPKNFRIYEDFEADNEVDISSIGIKTTNIYKQNPVPNGCHIISELDDVSKSCYYESPLGYDTIVWYVYEVKKN